jgi:PAS domain S-box-containing protein
MNQDQDKVRETDKQLEKPASTIPGGIGTDLDSGKFELVDFAVPGFVKATSRYEVLEEIGRGGMGIVYLAQDWQLHRHVAIKILRAEFVNRPRIIRRFIDEARIMGTLQHPGIINIYECGHCEDGRPFHAMTYIEGRTLSAIIKNETRNQFLTARLLNVFARVCHTIAYAHSRGVFHLDLKPANFMIGEYGAVHVMDWGLARIQDETVELGSFHQLDSQESVALTEKQRVQGTLEYMSPEQARGELLDQRTDVFCLGAMLFEILTGLTIYQADERTELHRQASLAIMVDNFEKLQQCGAHPSLIRLAEHCLEPDQNRRPVKATVLAAELSAYQASTLEQIQNDMTRFFELSLDLFCIAGFDGYFRRINSNFSRVLGFSDAELISRPFLDFVHENDRAPTIKAMAVLKEGQPVVRFRNRYRTIDGHYMEFEWTAKSIPAENVIFAVARNLSDSIEHHT